MVRFVGSAWDKEREEFSLEYEAAAFVHHMRSEDGAEIWVEACEDRLVEWEECWKIPDRIGRDPEHLGLNPES